MNNEEKILSGIAKIIENKQTQNVAVIKGKTPNDGGLFEGAHLFPTNRFQNPYLLKAKTDSPITKQQKQVKSEIKKIK